MIANVYRVFTLDSGVTEGATVGTFTLKNGTKISAIIMGESGRGRSLGILAVQLPRDLYAEWQEKGQVRVFAGKIGKTKSDNFKLFVEKEATTEEKIIAVMPTKIGYRGGNSHTGDRKETQYKLTYSGREKVQEASQADGAKLEDARRAALLAQFDTSISYKTFDAEVREALMEVYGLSEDHFESSLTFHEFPGEVLVKGSTAQGAAGRMGSGTQMVSLLPKDVWFRTGYSGRLYGGPSAHYYMWNGEEMTGLTWKERQLLEATDEVEEVEWL